MIKSFKHKGLQNFFETGSLKDIQAIHARKISRILYVLNNAVQINDVNLSGFDLHPLKGNLKGLWAVTVQANWRITFKFDGQDVYIVDYRDYH